MQRKGKVKGDRIMDDEERIEACQREIRRLRCVVRFYESGDQQFLEWMKNQLVEGGEDAIWAQKAIEYFQQIRE